MIKKILELMDPMKGILLGVAFFALSAGAVWGVDAIGDAREATVSAKYERKIQAAVDESVRQAAKIQGRVDDANAKYQTAMGLVADASKRIDTLSRRVRDAGPSAGAIANAPATTLRQYATEVGRDFEDCRGRYATLGNIAAGASEAAWAHRIGWPSWDKSVKEFDEKTKGIFK